MEQWRSVVGYEGLYSVSDQGRVRSEKGGVILRPQPNSRGYQRVWLGRGNVRFIHQLVLETFVGDRPEGMWALHGDDDHANNQLSNLRWGTRTENAHDQVMNGHNHNANKMRCIDGHEFTPANTLPNGPNGRGCRECGRRRSRDYMRRKSQRHTTEYSNQQLKQEKEKETA